MERKCRNGKAELEENCCECRYEFTTFEFLTARTISVGGAQRYVLKCCEMSLEQRIGDPLGGDTSLSLCIGIRTGCPRDFRSLNFTSLQLVSTKNTYMHLSSINGGKISS